MENRIVVDTNIMVSFLIGKRLRKLKDKLTDSTIITEQLIQVTGDKDLLELLEYKGTKIISASVLEKLL